MISKNLLKFIKSLQIKKQRDEHQQFIVEGRKCVLELLRSDYAVETVFYTKEYEKEVEPYFKKSHFELISAAELASISRLETNTSLLALAHMKEQEIQDFSGFSMVLDGIRDPGNLGTIIRTADWFGIKNIICSSDTVDFYNPKVITSTMGSFARTNVVYTDLLEYIPKIKEEHNLKVFGTLLKGESLYTLKAKNGLIIIGNESKGISEKMINMIDVPVTIEGRGDAESLNAAVAASIVMYELTKS